MFWDRLYQRYADPFSFINGMIQAGRFREFVESFFATIKKDKEEETRWQFWLHKVFDGSFSDFMADLETNEKNQKLSARTIETTMRESMNILKNFNPNSSEKGGDG